MKKILTESQKEQERIAKYHQKTQGLTNIALFKVLIDRMESMSDRTCFPADICKQYAELKEELSALMQKYKKVGE